MSLIATLFTNSCADGALVPAGGVWARATEANRQQPTVISSDLFMISSDCAASNLVACSKCFPFATYTADKRKLNEQVPARVPR
jgi:hypothetical protein